MDAKLLEYFLRVAELGSINKAAAALHISQPALSRYIATLERELRVTLLHRTAGGVRPTEAGKTFCDRARPILRQMALLNEELFQQVAGHVALGVPPSWQRLITGPLVKRVTDECPRVALRVYEGIHNLLRDYMNAGLVDLAVVAAGMPQLPGFSRTPLVREPLLLVGDKKAGLDPADPVTLSRLRHVKLVMPGGQNVIRQYVEHMLTRHNHPFCIAVEAETLTLCLELARRGVGYTVTPYCALYEHPRGGELSWAPIRRLELAWALVENQARLHSSAVRDTRRLLLEQVAHRISSGEWATAEQVVASQPVLRRFQPSAALRPASRPEVNAQPRPRGRIIKTPHRRIIVRMASPPFVAIKLLGRWTGLRGRHIPMGSGCSCGPGFPGLQLNDFEQQILDYLRSKHGTAVGNSIADLLKALGRESSAFSRDAQKRLLVDLQRSLDSFDELHGVTPGAGFSRRG